MSKDLKTTDILLYGGIAFVGYMLFVKKTPTPYLPPGQSTGYYPGTNVPIPVQQYPNQSGNILSSVQQALQKLLHPSGGSTTPVIPVSNPATPPYVPSPPIYQNPAPVTTEPPVSAPVDDGSSGYSQPESGDDDPYTYDLPVGDSEEEQYTSGPVYADPDYLTAAEYMFKNGNYPGAKVNVV